MHKIFDGENKYLEIFKGNHNTRRPPEVLKRVMEKIHTHVEALELEEKKLSTFDELKETPN